MNKYVLFIGWKIINENHTLINASISLWTCWGRIYLRFVQLTVFLERLHHSGTKWMLSSSYRSFARSSRTCWTHLPPPLLIHLHSPSSRTLCLFFQCFQQLVYGHHRHHYRCLVIRSLNHHLLLKVVILSFNLIVNSSLVEFLSKLLSSSGILKQNCSLMKGFIWV